MVATTLRRFAALCMICSVPCAMKPYAAQASEVRGYFGGNFGLPSFTEPLREGFALGVELAGVRNPSIAESGASDLKWLAGGGVSVPVRGGLYVIGDVTYNRLGSTTLSVSGGGLPTSVSAQMKVNVLDFSGGAEYRFQSQARKVEPFVAGAVGVARTSVSGTAGGVSLNVSESQSDLAVHFGGGLRIYLGENWGVRPEFKVMRLPGETFSRAAVGVFYQFSR